MNRFRFQRRTRGLPHHTILLWVLSALAWPQAHGENWPRFRGPNGSGLSDAANIPSQWSTDEQQWTAQLPGQGHSSPVVWDQRLFVTSADKTGGRQTLSCLDTRSGTELWKHSWSFTPYKKHKNNSFASNSPAVDSDHVYILRQTRQSSPLTALDHSGHTIWEYDLGPYQHGQGGGTSPIVHEDLVIVCNDHAAGSFLVALDRRTGRERWKVPRQGQRACYATPCVYAIPGRKPELVFAHCFEGITGVDPQTGHQNWMIDVFGTFSQRAVGSPITAGNLLIASSGARVAEKNVVAVRPAPADGKREVAEVFRVTRAAPHVPTPLVYQRWLFLWADNGVVTCVSLNDGQRVWQQRVGGNYFASPICIAGRLFCPDRDGNMLVIAAAAEFQSLGRTALGRPTMATPAVGDGRLFVRTASHVFAVGGTP
ncbi:MAG: PQQ-binding-like beta-propeller repeat protein [Planctomycetaceae bacterium]